MTFPASNINYSAQEDLYSAVISGPISIFIILLTIFWYNFWIQWTIWPHNSINASAGMHWLVWRIRSTAFFPDQTGNSCFSSDKRRPKINLNFILHPQSGSYGCWRTKAFSGDTYPESKQKLFQWPITLSLLHFIPETDWSGICLCRLLIHSEYLLKKSWKEI